MNHILQLKGEFHQKKNTSRPGAPELPAGTSVTVGHLRKLEDDLKQVLNFWLENKLLQNQALVSAYYRMVVAKSNRIKGLLVQRSDDPNDYVVGAKFSQGESPKHIITYCVDKDSLKESINRLKKAADIVQREFSGEIDKEGLLKITDGEMSLPDNSLKKTHFAKVIVDANFVTRFDVDRSADEIDEAAIVSLYDVGEDSQKLLARLGISIGNMRFLERDTFYATPEQFTLLKQRAPYLIAMSVSDLSTLSLPEGSIVDDSSIMTISNPTNEPTIGVIDTVFKEGNYFDSWVDNRNCVSKDIPGSNSDHGTEVTSIIVDGPSFNPNLEDGCGQFRVRHFGVTRGGKTSSFEILRDIKDIVTANTDIKVWNLSLGALQEVNPNFISPEAAILDRLQTEYDVIFVIAATNRGVSNPNAKRIGAPADSLNSIVVGAVDDKGTITDYSREGPVLSFFVKPDICYFGGTDDNRITTYSSLGEKRETGTSFAAPWITRKVAYLIYIMGFSRQVAKALLIDSATGWRKNTQDTMRSGFGVVPTNINDILRSQSDEIRFVLFGTSSAYDTYNYNIPLPLDDGKFPYVARATLCYFPTCSRNQGVDYTDTELDIHFGRLKGKGIKSIDNNQQGDAERIELYEEEARKHFRKWDNVKHIGEVLKPNARLRKSYEFPRWGLSMKTKQRLSVGGGRNLDFGIVITLKNIKGENRIQEFENLCRLRGWLVTDVDVETQIEVYNQADTDIKWE